MSVGQKAILVVGGDSFIGRSLIKRHEATGATVFWTSRRKQESERVSFLDFSLPLVEWELPPGIAVAYLCAAVTRIKDCEENPAAAYKANVESMLYIAEKLLNNGIFVIFLSTNSVFSGARPKQRSDGPYSPISEYGRQKAEAEQRMLVLPGNKAIVRLTKVLSSDSGLVSHWVAKLNCGERLSAFGAMYMAPISLKFAVDLLYRIGEGRWPGIYQISGLEDLSYANFAQLLAIRLGASSSIVDISNSCVETHHVAAARYSTLDMTEVTRRFGITPQPVLDVIDDLLSA
jgi:dTDP-4-dehydrorhamnose reductase